MTNEICYTIIGKKLGPFWIGWLTNGASGGEASVKFDGLWTLEREEAKGDVLGFYHTHPGGPSPSPCDIKTMNAWVTCFWKDLFCIIKGYLKDDTYVFRPLTIEKHYYKKPFYCAIMTYPTELTAKIGRVIFGITP